MAHFVQYFSQWYFISHYLERFGFMNERMISTPVLLSDLRGFPFSGCGWSMAMRVCLIGNIDCPFRNIPPVSASSAGDTAFFSGWHMFDMEPFSFGLGVSVVGW